MRYTERDTRISTVKNFKGDVNMYEKLQENLKRKRIGFKYFENREQAAAYLTETLKGEKIAFGGSVTLQEMGLYEKLRENNEVYWHWIEKKDEQREIEAALTTYILSANAVAETGEIVNIDGTGNRVANAIYGPSKVFYVVGENKICENLHSAIDRARNIAAPLNAKRLGLSTPCAADGKCHDCASEQRICNAMTVIMSKPGKIQLCEVIVIGEKLGY